MRKQSIINNSVALVTSILYNIHIDSLTRLLVSTHLLIYLHIYLPAATGNSAEAPFSDKSIKSHVSTTSFSINGSSSYIHSIYIERE